MNEEEHQHDHHGENEKDGPFSSHERRRLRQIIEADDRVKWLGRTIRMWAAWIAAGMIGVFALSDRLKSALKAWLQ